MKIFLIGLMGCGKSFIGKKLADKLGFDFIDLDTLIIEKEKRSISQIFEEEGETYFRKIESDVLMSLKTSQNVVVATGGGAPCFFNNMAWMNQNGITVYLKTKSTLLYDRLLKEADKRPLVRGKSGLDLLTFIKEKARERAPFYTQAQIVIKQNKDFEEIEIIKLANTIVK